jgi:hypothetical protein
MDTSDGRCDVVKKYDFESAHFNFGQEPIETMQISGKHHVEVHHMLFNADSVQDWLEFDFKSKESYRTLENIDKIKEPLKGTDLVDHYASGVFGLKPQSGDHETRVFSLFINLGQADSYLKIGGYDESAFAENSVRFEIESVSHNSFIFPL